MTGRPTRTTSATGSKWSDGEPLTAEDIAYTINRRRDEEWLNYDSTGHESHRQGHRRRDRRDHVARCRTRSCPDSMDVYIVPKHIWGKSTPTRSRSTRATTGSARARSRSTSASGASTGRMEANPNYWGGEPTDRRGRLPGLQQPRRDGRRAREGRDRRRPQRPLAGVRAALDDGGIVAVVRAQQGGFDELVHQRRRGRPRRRPHPGPARPSASAQAIAHAIDKQTLVDRVYVGLGSAGDDRQPVAEPGVDPGAHRGGAVRVRPREGEPDPRRRGLRGHRRRRHPRDARRRRALEFRYAVRSESEVAPPIAEFVSGWLNEIGIETDDRADDDGRS